MEFSETRFYQDVFQKGLEQGLQRESGLVLRLLRRRCGVLGITYGTLRERLPTAGSANDRN
jgi:hypothetical protein